jgi:hypothetical protein
MGRVRFKSSCIGLVHMSKMRTLIESSAAIAEVDTATLNWPRFESAWEGWTWRIARGPEKGFPVPQSPGVFLFKSHEAFHTYGVPVTLILYRVIDEDRVEIISVRVLS